jgi:hypothetical protein
VATALLLLWVHAVALAASRPGASAVGALLRGWRAVPAVVAGAPLFMACWWITAKAFDWHAAYAGQIDAWIIASSGRSGTAWLHRAIDWTIWLLRWGVGLTASLSLAARLAGDGALALTGRGWFQSALHPGRWIAVALLIGVAVALPWHWIYWRPAHVSLAMEPWFVGGKLAVAAVVAAIGWALALRIVMPRQPDRVP